MATIHSPHIAATGIFDGFYAIRCLLHTTKEEAKVVSKRSDDLSAKSFIKLLREYANLLEEIIKNNEQ